MVERTITVSDEHAKWLDARLASGRFGSVSEVIEALIDEKTLRPMSNEEIAEALRAGEASGISTIPPRDFLAKLKAEFAG